MPFVCPLPRAAFAGLLLAFAATVPASEGTLDPRFGDGGRSALSIAGVSGPTRLLVRPDGRLVFAARRPDQGDVVVGALGPDGQVDVGFHGGIPLAVPTGGALYAPQLAAYPTGQAFLLTVAEYSGGVYRPIVCQVRDDGSFDPGFTSGQYPGQSGCLRLDVPATTPNGVVLAGIAPAEAYGILRFAGTGYDFASSTHTTFPITGLLLTGTAENPSSAITRENSAYANVAINAFGLFSLDSGGVALYFAGSHLQGGDTNIYVGRRFYGAGSSYSETSYAPNLVAAGVDSAQALALDELGRVVVASSVDAGGGVATCLVQRYTPTLAPDTGFGPLNNGRRYVSFGAAAGDAARCDAVAAYGSVSSARILLGGALRPNGSARSDMVVTRLLGDGSFDADFGNTGYARFNSTPAGVSPGLSEQVLALGLQADRAILAGPSEPAGGTGGASAMFLRLTGDALFAGGFD